MHCKSTDGVLIVSGQENYEWMTILWQSLQHFDAAQTGHLYVQKNEIRIMTGDRVNAGEAVFAVFDDSKIRKRFEPCADATSCGRLIVNDYDLVLTTCAHLHDKGFARPLHPRRFPATLLADCLQRRKVLSDVCRYSLVQSRVSQLLSHRRAIGFRVRHRQREQSSCFHFCLLRLSGVRYLDEVRFRGESRFPPAVEEPGAALDT